MMARVPRFRFVLSAILLSSGLVGCFSSSVDPYAIYYGDQVILQLKPTGEERCDNYRRLAVRLFSPKVAEFKLSMDNQRAAAGGTRNRGLATSPEAESDSRDYR